jgi:hypothetical protein
MILSTSFNILSNSNNADIQINVLDGLFTFLTSVYETKAELFLADQNIAERCIELAIASLSYPNFDVNKKICAFFTEVLKNQERHGDNFEVILRYMSPKLIDVVLKVCEKIFKIVDHD